MAKQPNYRGNLYRKIISIDGVKIAVTAKSEKELNKKVIAKQVAIEKGEVILNKSTTVKYWTEQWLETYKKPKVLKSTYIKMCYVINKNILSVIGNKRISDVKRIDLQKLLNSHKGESFSHLTKIKMYITAIFTEAEKDNLIKDNPAKFLELPESTKKTTRVMTDEEYIATMEICKTHRAGAWIMLMLQCGLRRGETIPLTWKDVDFDKRLLYINKSVEYVGNKPVLKSMPKTKAGVRVVGIPDTLFDMFVNMKKKTKNELIFTGARTSNFLTITQIKQLWKSFKRELNLKLGAETYRNKITVSKIEGLHLHCLRHTCITRLLLSGADVKFVQVFAGHEDISTTLNIYTHIAPEQAAEYLKNYQKVVTFGVTKNEE